MPQGSLAKKLDTPESKEGLGKNTAEKVENTLTEELVIGVCYPIGSSKDELINVLRSVLTEDYAYDVRIIKLSKYIADHGEIELQEVEGQTNEFSTFMHKIDNGNLLRKKFNNAILAELAIKDIHLKRMRGEGKDPIPLSDLKSQRTCYIIDSLKNEDELNLFRKVYRDIFYLFSVFSPKHIREDNLINKRGLSRLETKRIIEIDESENNNHGQNVRETFVDADFFVRLPSVKTNTLEDKVKRYINLIFETQIVTPLTHEIAMYEAKSVAGNSACMSRQVGAVITTTQGEIIARGWNDVPKFGGNLITEDTPRDNDFRCFKYGGMCRNDNKKDLLSKEIAESLVEKDIIEKLLKYLEIEINNEELNKKLTESKFNSFIQLFQDRVRRSSKVKDLIEFSRSVHAEMHAIIIGSQLSSDRMVGGKLFCTTFPCHNCGRHIILSGIQEIYYIEPYVKSLCLELHEDSMTDDESDSEDTKNKVKILMYDGVAPRRYLEFFSMKEKRKLSDGNYALIDPKKAMPKNRMSLQALPTLEEQTLHSLRQQHFEI